MDIVCQHSGLSCVFVIRRRPPISTCTATLFPHTTLFRSLVNSAGVAPIMIHPAIREAVTIDGLGGWPKALDPEAFHHEHGGRRSEEHTSELQSLMRTSYAGFCLKKQMILSI